MICSTDRLRKAVPLARNDVGDIYVLKIKAGLRDESRFFVFCLRRKNEGE